MKKYLLATMSSAAIMGFGIVYSAQNLSNTIITSNDNQNKKLNQKNANNQNKKIDYDEGENGKFIREWERTLDILEFGGTDGQGYIKEDYLLAHYTERYGLKALFGNVVQGREIVYGEFYDLHNLSNGQEIETILVSIVDGEWIPDHSYVLRKTVTGLKTPINSAPISSEKIDIALQSIELQFEGRNSYGAISDNPVLNAKNDGFEFVVGWTDTNLWPSAFANYTVVNDMKNGHIVYIMVRIDDGLLIDNPLKTWTRTFIVDNLTLDPNIITVDKDMVINILNLIVLKFEGIQLYGSIAQNTILEKKYAEFHFEYSIKLNKDEGEWSEPIKSYLDVKTLRNDNLIRVGVVLNSGFNWLNNDMPSYTSITRTVDHLAYDNTYFVPKDEMPNFYGKQPDYNLRDVEKVDYDGAAEAGEYNDEMRGVNDYSRFQNIISNANKNNAIDPLLFSSKEIEDISETPQAPKVSTTAEMEKVADLFKSTSTFVEDGYIKGTSFTGVLMDKGRGTEITQTEYVTGRNDASLGLIMYSSTANSTIDAASFKWEVTAAAGITGKGLTGEVNAAYSQETEDSHKVTNAETERHDAKFATIPDKTNKATLKTLGGWYEGYLFVEFVKDMNFNEREFSMFFHQQYGDDTSFNNWSEKGYNFPAGYRMAIPWKVSVLASTASAKLAFGLETTDSYEIPDFVPSDDPIRLATNTLPYQANEMEMTSGAAIDEAILDANPNHSLNDIIEKAKIDKHLNEIWDESPNESSIIKNIMNTESFELYDSLEYQDASLFEYTQSHEGFFIGNNHELASVIKEQPTLVGPGAIRYRSGTSHTEEDAEKKSTTWSVGASVGITIKGFFSFKASTKESWTNSLTTSKSTKEGFSTQYEFNVEDGYKGSVVQRRPDDLFAGYLFWLDDNTQWKATPLKINIFSESALSRGITSFVTFSKSPY